MKEYKDIAIHLPRHPSERVWNVIGYSIFIASIIFLIMNWTKLPSEVPAHYSALGEVDRWGSKFELTILPFIAIMTMVVIEPLEKRPHLHNYPKKVKEDHLKTAFTISRKMINKIKNLCLIIFALMTIESSVIALNWWDGFGPYFLPLFLIVIFYPIVEYMIKIFRL